MASGMIKRYGDMSDYTQGRLTQVSLPVHKGDPVSYSNGDTINGGVPPVDITVPVERIGSTAEIHQLFQSQSFDGIDTSDIRGLLQITDKMYVAYANGVGWIIFSKDFNQPIINTTAYRPPDDSAGMQTRSSLINLPNLTTDLGVHYFAGIGNSPSSANAILYSVDLLGNLTAVASKTIDGGYIESVLGESTAIAISDTSFSAAMGITGVSQPVAWIYRYLGSVANPTTAVESMVITFTRTSIIDTLSSDRFASTTRLTTYASNGFSVTKVLDGCIYLVSDSPQGVYGIIARLKMSNDGNSIVMEVVGTPKQFYTSIYDIDTTKSIFTNCVITMGKNWIRYVYGSNALNYPIKFFDVDISDDFVQNETNTSSVIAGSNQSCATDGYILAVPISYENVFVLVTKTRASVPMSHYCAFYNRALQNAYSTTLDGSPSDPMGLVQVSRHYCAYYAYNKSGSAYPYEVDALGGIMGVSMDYQTYPGTIRMKIY